MTSLIQAELEIQTAAIEKRYDKEISQAEGNNYKVKKLEEQKQKELAKKKNEANKKMFAMQVIQAVAQTAQNAISAYGSAAAIPLVGYILAPVAAAMAVAAGAIQIAAIKSSSKRVKARAMPRVASLRKAPSSKKWAWFMPGNGWRRRRCLPTRLRVLSSTPWTMRSGLTPSDPYEPMMLVGRLRLLHIARHSSNSLSSCSSSRTDWLRLQSCRTQRQCRVMLIR